MCIRTPVEPWFVSRGVSRSIMAKKNSLLVQSVCLHVLSANHTRSTGRALLAIYVFPCVPFGHLFTVLAVLGVLAILVVACLFRASLHYSNTM